MLFTMAYAQESFLDLNYLPKVNTFSSKTDFFITIEDQVKLKDSLVFGETLSFSLPFAIGSIKYTRNSRYESNVFALGMKSTRQGFRPKIELIRANTKNAWDFGLDYYGKKYAFEIDWLSMNSGAIKSSAWTFSLIRQFYTDDKLSANMNLSYTSFSLGETTLADFEFAGIGVTSDLLQLGITAKYLITPKIFVVPSMALPIFSKVGEGEKKTITDDATVTVGVSLYAEFN